MEGEEEGEKEKEGGEEGEEEEDYCLRGKGRRSKHDKLSVVIMCGINMSLFNSLLYVH